MFARLWWKEARRVWPIWAFLAGVGLVLHGLVRSLAGPGHVDGYLHLAGVVTVIYLFLIAAAAFAGEREDGTLGLLDALPVERWRLWRAKASFSLATTLALGALLWLSAVAYGGIAAGLGTATAAAFIWGTVALGWGLFWSALLGSAMGAAVLAMASLGATLAALVNLQEGPTTEAAPALLAIALATAAASAFLFVRDGPPRRERLRTRPPAPAAERPAPFPLAPAGSAAPGDARRPARVWTYSVGRLVWETWRQIRADLKMLLAVALGSIVYLWLTEWDRHGPGMSLPAMAILGLMTGVAAFNTENRGRTQRFLNQHGARPGVVWGVKAAMWWLAMVALCLVAVSPAASKITGDLGVAGSRVPGRDPLATVIAVYLGALTVPFAVGALCGMAFRRGITAAAMAVVFMIVLMVVLGYPLSNGLMTASALVYIPLALLFVTWAWSGDWLRLPPGLGKWARLGGWCAATAAVLIVGYVGGRAWSVPALPEAQARALFQPERFERPAPPDENAAPLYEEAARLVQAHDDLKGGPKGVTRWVYAVLNDPPANLDVAAWLEKVEPALKLIREGARRPYLAYPPGGVDTVETLARPTREPFEFHLTAPLIASIRARLDRGDLDGAWTDVETLLRMARQYSTVRGRTYFNIDRQAVARALTWAADARQTADSLEKALAAFRALPAGFTPADRIRADRAAFQRTMDLPATDLIDMILGVYGYDGRRRVGLEQALQARAISTPWEVARARRAYDLLAADWIEIFGDQPYVQQPPPGVFLTSWPWIPQRDLVIDPGDGAGRRISVGELSALPDTTPLVRLNGPGLEATWYLRLETDRRALAMVLRLRLFQARHDGALPASLDDLAPVVEGADDDGGLEDVDPYGGIRFGYVESSGQRVYPIEDAASQGMNLPAGSPVITTPPGEYRLLYSVGPDHRDDRALRNLDNMRDGDIIYPLKDGVKPPPAGSP